MELTFICVWEKNAVSHMDQAWQGCQEAEEGVCSLQSAAGIFQSLGPERDLATSYPGHQGLLSIQKLMCHAVVGILFARSNCLRIQTHSRGLQTFKGKRPEACDPWTQTDLRTFCSLFSRTRPSIIQTTVITPLTSQGLQGRATPPFKTLNWPYK